MRKINKARVVIALNNGSAPLVTVNDAAPASPGIGDNNPPPLGSDTLQRVPELAYASEQAKDKLLVQLRTFFGIAGVDDSTKADARHEIVIGLAAAKLPVDEFPRKAMTIIERISYVSDLVDNYQAPSTATDKVPSLRKGKTGWRTEVQHKAIRNAEDRASKYLAEVGAGNAKTEAEKNAAKRNPAPHHGKETKSADDLNNEIGQPAPVTAQAFAAMQLNMLSSLMQHANKHAKVAPMEFNPVTEGIIALHKLALECDKAFHARLARQDAERAAKETD